MFSIFLITICLFNLILICHATNLSVLVKIPISTYLLEKQNRVGVKKTLTFKKRHLYQRNSKKHVWLSGWKSPINTQWNASLTSTWSAGGQIQNSWPVSLWDIKHPKFICNLSIFREEKKYRNIAAPNSQLYRFRICLYFLGTGWRWALFNRCLPYQLCCLVLRVRDDMRRLWHDKCVFLSLLTPSERET